MMPDVDRDALLISSAAELMQDGRLTAVALLERVIARLDATEPYVHAYASLCLDQAFRDAEEADHTPYGGPLHGIPFGVKDVIATQGAPTECGSRVFAGHRTSNDAWAVARLRAAGAILVGKHATHELTCGLDEPATRNPYKLTHYPGGSSAGSGVSVAVGSAMFALGTDAAGSVRIPASATGVVGLKPTHGLLSTDGIARAATAPSIDHVGILARTVDDAGLVLKALARGRATTATEQSLEGVRLGVLWPGVGETVDPEVAALFDAAISASASRGAEPVRVRIPGLHDAPRVCSMYFTAEVAEGNRDLSVDRTSLYHPAVWQLIADGLAVDDARLRSARRARASISTALTAVFENSRVDALLSPTMLIAPPALADLDPPVDLPRLTARTSVFNLSGHPALSVPCGRTAAGLPVGLQLAGRLHDETTLLRIARALESALNNPPLQPWS